MSPRARVAPPFTGPAPVTLVTGPEELLRDRAVATIKAASRAADAAHAGAPTGAGAPEDTGATTEMTELTVAGLEPGVFTCVTSPSLFEERKVIVLRDLLDASDALATEIKAYLADPAPDTAVVLVHGGGVKGKALIDAIKKAGADVVECKAVKWESDKVAFTVNEFKQARRRVTGDGAAALVDAVGQHLRELASACSQLVSDTTGTVDRAVVERYHAGRVEVTGFKVADAAVEGRCEDALRLLRQALATGSDPVPINAALAMALRNLARVGSASRVARPDDLARELGLAPFIVRKVRGQLPGWTEEGVAAAITIVARADGQIKGAGTDPVYAIEQAVVGVARSRGQR